MIGCDSGVSIKGVNMRSTRKLLGIALCIWLSLSLAIAGWSAEPPRYIGLTILHTNDIHGHLFPLDYYDNGDMHLRDVGGAARQAALIRQIKSTSPYPVLVMSAGDVFTRGPIRDFDGVPDFDVMNTIPYDVMTLGNNEFEGGDGLPGQKILFDRIKQAHFPVLCANVFYKANGKTIVPPYKIYDINGVKIGVFGLTAPRVATYSTAEGLDVRDPNVIAKQIVSELREKADFIIALTHIGYDYGDLPLVAAVPGIDVIIGGDSHTWLSQPTLVPEGKDDAPSFCVKGTIIDQTGEHGVAVGRIDLRLRHAEGHRYRVMGYSAKQIYLDSSLQPSEDISHLVERYVKPLRKQLARLDKGIPKPEMAGWLAECLRDTAGAQVGLVFNDTIENGLSAGPVDSLALRRMLPSQHRLVKATATGKQLTDFISSRNPILSGAKVVEGKLYIDEQPAVETQNYTVATMDFWGLIRPTELGKAEFVTTDVGVWDAVAKYLNEH